MVFGFGVLGFNYGFRLQGFGILVGFLGFRG